MSEEKSHVKVASKVWIGVDIGGTKTAVILLLRTAGDFGPNRVPHVAGTRARPRTDIDSSDDSSR